jgi:hypothetical protein
MSILLKPKEVTLTDADGVTRTYIVSRLPATAVVLDGGKELQLSTRALVDNHCPDWEILAKLEVAMMEHNVSFFRDGRALSFFEAFARKAQPWISRTLTDLLEPLSQKGKPPSTN